MSFVIFVPFVVKSEVYGRWVRLRRAGGALTVLRLLPYFRFDAMTAILTEVLHGC